LHEWFFIGPITHNAQDTLRDPDAALLLMLQKGQVRLQWSWYEVVFGTFPFASLFLLAASPHHHGGISPTVSTFLRILPTLDWRCPSTGRPLLSKNFFLLRKFISTTSALGIPFNVRDVVLPLSTTLVRVGIGKSTAWDNFFTWMIDAVHPYETAPTAPMSVLSDIISRLDDLVRVEALIESRLVRDCPPASSAYSVSTPAAPDPADCADESPTGYESLLPYDHNFAVAGGTPPFSSARCKTCLKDGVRGSDFCEPCDRPLVPSVYCDSCSRATRRSWWDLHGCRHQLSSDGCGGNPGTDIVIGKCHTIPTPRELEMMRKQLEQAACLLQGASSTSGYPPHNPTCVQSIRGRLWRTNNLAFPHRSRRLLRQLRHPTYARSTRRSVCLPSLPIHHAHHTCRPDLT